MTDNNTQEKHIAPEPEKKNSWTGRIVIIVLFIAAVAVYFAVPSVHEWVNNVIAMFKTGNFDDMREFISKYGKWAMLVSASTLREQLRLE